MIWLFLCVVFIISNSEFFTSALKVHFKNCYMKICFYLEFEVIMILWNIIIIDFFLPFKRNFNVLTWNNMNCDGFRITMLFKIMLKSNTFHSFLFVTFYVFFTNVCSNFVLLFSPFTNFFLSSMLKCISRLHWQLTCIVYFFVFIYVHLFMLYV